MMKKEIIFKKRSINTKLSDNGLSMLLGALLFYLMNIILILFAVICLDLEGYFFLMPSQTILLFVIILLLTKPKIKTEYISVKGNLIGWKYSCQ